MRKVQQREEMEAKLKNSLLPNEMKREIMNKELGGMYEGHNDTQIPARREPNHVYKVQMFDGFNGRNMPQNQPQKEFMMNRVENINHQGQIPGQLPNQLPNQMHGQRNMQRQNLMQNQRINQVPPNIQNQMPNNVPQQIPVQRVQSIPGQIQRMPMVANMRQKIPAGNQIVQEIPQRGRNIINTGNNLVPNNRNRQVYNSPNVAQGRNQNSNRIPNHQREFVVNKSPNRNEDMRIQHKRMPPNHAGNPYRGINSNGNGTMHNKQSMNQKNNHIEEDFDKIDFFPK